MRFLLWLLQSLQEKKEKLYKAIRTGLKKCFKNFWLIRRENASFGFRSCFKILPFTASYFCEKEFSSMIYIKNELRTTLIDLAKIDNEIPGNKTKKNETTILVISWRLDQQNLFIISK